MIFDFRFSIWGNPRRERQGADDSPRYASRSVPRLDPRSIHPSSNPSSHPSASAAFSLIEILVTVGILSFIILGLLAMFNQTQRAFRSSMTQSDVLEAGRAVTEMFSRDLEQMTPSESPSTYNFIAEVAMPSRLDPAFAPAYFFQELPPSPPATQFRTNLFYQCFFLTHENVLWNGIGYLVDTPTNGFGTLYRFQYQLNTSLYPFAITNLVNEFQKAAWLLYGQNPGITNYTQSAGITNPSLTRIADGVVDLRLRPYSPSGLPLTTTNFVLNATITANNLPAALKPNEQDCFFSSNAVPGYVELEIGFLEDRTLSRLKSLPNIGNAQGQYLQTHSAQVHLFRQRVAIRNVDFTAYPYP